MRTALLLTLTLLVLATPLGAQTTVAGTKSNNTAAPTTSPPRNLPVMPAIACAAAQAYTTGRVVFPCTNLFGYTGIFLTNPTTGAALTPAIDVAEDDAEVSGATGPLVLSVRRDTAATSSTASGEYATFNTDGLGRLWTRPGRPCDDEARITNVAINISTATTTELVALASGQTIYVCGYHFITTLANNVTWKYGTGSACGTGTASLTGAEPYAANGGIAMANSGAVQMKTISANALCLTTSAATQISGAVLVVQTAAP